MTVDIVDGISVLRPTEGYKITNTDRSFYSNEVWLGTEDSQENYIEAIEPNIEPERPRRRWI